MITSWEAGKEGWVVKSCRSFMKAPNKLRARVASSLSLLLHLRNVSACGEALCGVVCVLLYGSLSCSLV